MTKEIATLREKLDNIMDSEAQLKKRLTQSMITIEFLEKQNKEYTSSAKDNILHHGPVESPQIAKLTEAIR